MIANADRIEQTLEIEREFFKIGHTQVIRDRAESENKVVIRNILAPLLPRTSGAWRARFTRRAARSIPATRARMNSVPCRLLRRGVVIWLGSRLLPATSASMGVK